MAGRPLLDNSWTCAVHSGAGWAGHRLAPIQSVFPQTRKKIDAQDSTQLVVTTARFCCPKLTLKFPSYYKTVGLPCGSVVKNPPANIGDSGSIPGSGRSPWRRKRQPTPVFLPGQSHGQRSLVGYGLSGCKE